MTLEQAISYTLGAEEEIQSTTSPVVPAAAGRSADPLTRREREVAALVARGLTERAIADQLMITEGTAGSHVTHILNKLGFRSRAQIAAWAVERGLVTSKSD